MSAILKKINKKKITKNELISCSAVTTDVPSPVKPTNPIPKKA